MITINFKNYLTRMLPSHKRQANRLMVFSWPFIALQKLFDAFVEWRTDVYYRLNITGQIIALQALLNRMVAGANDDILVKGYTDEGLVVQLSTEEGDSYILNLSLESEGTGFAEVALEGELRNDSDVDFWVYIPAAVNSYEVQQWVNAYKIAGKRYEIIQ